jgi:hypothetical protein
MKTSPSIAGWIATLALLLPILTSCANSGPSVPDPRLVGQWHGQDRFGGMSYDEIVKHRVEAQNVDTVLNIAADGRVTGRVGGAELSACAVAKNRGWLGRWLHIKTDFIIQGQVIGAVVPGSESSLHQISAPFNLDGPRISGTMFVLHPFSYPYPFLQFRLDPISPSK